MEPIFQTIISSNFDGEFKLTDVEPGFLQLQVSAVGFEPYISGDLMVTNSKLVDIVIQLKEANIQLEEVVVKPSPFKKTTESPVSLRRINGQLGVRLLQRN